MAIGHSIYSTYHIVQLLCALVSVHVVQIWHKLAWKETGLCSMNMGSWRGHQEIKTREHLMQSCMTISWVPNKYSKRPESLTPDTLDLGFHIGFHINEIGLGIGRGEIDLLCGKKRWN